MSIFFPVLGALIGIELPGYLVSYILSLVLILFLFIYSSKFYLSFSWLRFLLIIFIVYVLLSNIYTFSVIAAEEKTTNIIYAIMIPWIILSMGLSLIPKERFNLRLFECKLFKTSHMLLFLSLVLFLIGATQIFEPGRVGLIGMINPIWCGRIFACLLLYITYDIFYNKQRTFINYISFLFGFYLLLESGSRGPLVAYILTSCIFFLYTTPLKKIIIIFGIFVILLWLVAIYIGGRMFDISIFSSLHRIDFFEFIFGNTQHNLYLGNGIGTFGLMYLNEDIIAYPHNIFLEIFFEFGMIGLLLFMAILYVFFKHFALNCITLTVCFFFFNSLFSGDLSSNNFLFLFLYISTYFKDVSLLTTKI